MIQEAPNILFIMFDQMAAKALPCYGNPVVKAPNISKLIFPKGPQFSTWCWTRFRISMKDNYCTKHLPSFFVLLSNNEMSWTHENLCVVHRTVKENHYDVWLRIPTLHRFQSKYLLELKQKIVDLFDSRVPGAETKVADMPQDFLYDDAIGSVVNL